MGIAPLRRDRYSPTVLPTRACAGQPEAQLNLGVMYQRGEVRAKLFTMIYVLCASMKYVHMRHGQAGADLLPAERQQHARRWWRASAARGKAAAMRYLALGLLRWGPAGVMSLQDRGLAVLAQCKDSTCSARPCATCCKPVHADTDAHPGRGIAIRGLVHRTEHSERTRCCVQLQHRTVDTACPSHVLVLCTLVPMFL